MIKRTIPRLVSSNGNVTEICSMEKAKLWSSAGEGGNTKSKTKRVMVSIIESLRTLKRMFPK